jgi:PRC-barrel domain
MDHALHSPLEAEELNDSNLSGATIYGPGDETVGTVSHVHGAGRDTQVIVDVGGFLGIGAKPVSLDMSKLNFMRNENGTIHATTSWTKDDLKSLPEHRHA